MNFYDKGHVRDKTGHYLNTDGLKFDILNQKSVYYCFWCVSVNTQSVLQIFQNFYQF